MRTVLLVSNDGMWELGAHSVGKHRLLSSYLRCWLPILGRWYGDLVVFDGFAGPGEYMGGEKGSPQIIIDAASKFVSGGSNQRVHCLLVELDPARFAHLQAVVERLRVSNGVRIQAVQGEFSEKVEPVLRSIAERQDTAGPVPSFFMIDPFGIKGVPFSFFQSLMALDKSECLFSFMWESIERFSKTDEFAPHMRELMGNDDWADLSGDALKEYVYARFEHRLREAGARYVLVFDLWNGGNHIYSLFFATKGIKGCDVFKQAIWSVDPTGSYSFLGYNPGQLPFDLKFDLSDLQNDLRRAFGTDWVPMESAMEFVQGDETRFHSGQLRRHTLAPLERSGAIEVDRPNGARQFSLDRGIRFRFVEQKEHAPSAEQRALF